MILEKSTGDKLKLWLAAYSNAGMDRHNARLIASLNQSNQSRESLTMIKSMSVSTVASVAAIQDCVAIHQQALSTIDSFDFDCFEVSNTVGRKNAFVLLIY